MGLLKLDASVMKTFYLSLAILSVWLAVSVPEQAAGEATLTVSEHSIRNITTEAVEPLGYFVEDPTLTSSRRLVTPTPFSHDGVRHGAFFFENSYEHQARVNRGRLFCVACFFTCFEGPPESCGGHSTAHASGWADAGTLRLGAHGEAAASFAPGVTFPGNHSAAQADTHAGYKNRFTILPGTSGLPVGAPVRLRWIFRLEGSTTITGGTFPQRTFVFASADLRMNLLRRIGGSPAPVANFRLSTGGTQAFSFDDVSTSTFGSVTHPVAWEAQNNLGQTIRSSDTSEVLYRDRDQLMFNTFSVDTARPPISVPFLDFEANVGETLEIFADLFTDAEVGDIHTFSLSVGSARLNFFGSLEGGIVDPENRGLQIVFEILSLRGDIDGDGDVDQDDLNVLLLDRGKSVSASACGVACDLDDNGTITALDARTLALLCTRSRCATQ